MGSPTIYFGARTLTLDLPYRQQIQPQQMTLRNASMSGIEERLNVRIDIMASFGFRYFVGTSNTTLKRNLQQWFNYAQEGGAWYFALDSADAVLTTLSGSSVAGATSVDVSSATGIVAGRNYILRSSTRMEIIKVSTVVGTTINLVEALISDWFSGDRFRSEFYWPGRLDKRDNVIVEVPPIWFDVNLDFVEDVQSI